MTWDQADEMGKARAQQITQARAAWVASVQPLTLVVFQGYEIAILESVDDPSSVYCWATIRRSDGTSKVTEEGVDVGYTLWKCPVLELTAAPKGAQFAVIKRI